MITSQHLRVRRVVEVMAGVMAEFSWVILMCALREGSCGLFTLC